MNWNRNEVCQLLSAKSQMSLCMIDGEYASIVHFEDARMRCELWIHERGVFLAADPERPVQGLPFFEISLPCTTLAPVPRSGMPTGLGMYSEPVSSATLRFPITRREDGSISLSGVWEGLIAPYTSNEDGA